MRLLFLTDRLGDRGGAPNHLRDLIAAASSTHTVVVASGRGWVRALASADEDSVGLEALDGLIASADVVHLQNVMNPAALRLAVGSGRAVATIQDHRVFCPGPGKTLPDGGACVRPFTPEICVGCMPDAAYRDRMLRVTSARRDALRGARLIALSPYMADALAQAGLPGAAVIPPWVAIGPPRTDPGAGFLLGGRLVAHKGADLGWEAWRQSGVCAPLFLAGAGRLAGALAGAVPLGWLDRSALQSQLRQVRALLFPARWQEPFGILGVEALAQGVPVIAMDRGGVREWASDGTLLVGDVSGMAEAIRALDQDPALALTLGEAGRLSVAERFSQAALYPKLEAIYAEVSGIRAADLRGSASASAARTPMIPANAP